jgi:hypothetical protein
VSNYGLALWDKPRNPLNSDSIQPSGPPVQENIPTAKYRVKLTHISRRSSRERL